METFITSYCKVFSNSLSVKGKLLFEEDREKELSGFLVAAYKKFDLVYPKYHKMDRLSKLGILTSELCLRNCDEWKSADKKNTALLFSNRSSSLDSDRVHAASLADKKNYFPSPSVFVYTLPNIVLGEIAIKQGICGENAFFVTDTFDAQLMFSYASILLESTNTNYLVCGWLNVDASIGEGFVYCVKKANFKEENTGQKLIHSPQQLHQLYNS